MDDLRKLYIEPTAKCNLECTMCFRNTWFDETFRDMPFSIYIKAIESMPASVETVFFGGMGEPLFHNDIVEMVKAASAKGKRVELLTNATLLTCDLSNALLKAGLDMLWVSMDSFNDFEYEKIRKHSRFEQVLTNISLFNQTRLKYEREIKLGIAFVVMKSNVGQLENLPKFMSKYNVDEVNISNVFPSDLKAEDEALYSQTFALERGTHKARSKIKLPYMDWDNGDVWKTTQALVLSQDTSVYIGEMPFKRREKYCRFVEEGTAFIRHDGDVSPCMAVLHSAVTSFCGQERRILHYSFGNIKECALIDIWNSEEYSGFRRRVSEFDFSPCMHCGHCENAFENTQDCIGNKTPTCGACLWSEGFISCP